MQDTGKMKPLVALILLMGSTFSACVHAPICPTPELSQPAPTAEGGPENFLVPKPLKTKVLAFAPKVLGSARIVVVGDVIPHTAVMDSARDTMSAEAIQSGDRSGFVELFSSVRSAIEDADFSMANLETPVAPKASKGVREFVFNAPVVLVSAMKDVGFDLLSMANNHVYDQGRQGLIETIQNLKASGMEFVGIGDRCSDAVGAKTITVQGFKIAFLSTSQLYNVRLNRKSDEACVSELDEAAILKETSRARAAGAEIVVLSVHWGTEYKTVPREEEVKLAHRLLDGGVDVIVGHHPHVLQPVEVYPASDGRMTFVAYSLGNFISNQSRFYAHGLQTLQAGYPRDGVILSFGVVRKDYGDSMVRVELADLSARPVWTENNALERVRNPKLLRRIRVVIDDAMEAEIRKELESLDVHREPAKTLELKKQLELFQDRRAAAALILGTDLVAE
jgi:hypothetical protein